ncbi:hypothetical protein [Halalkalibacter akibai]|uniref:Uncharacterized protein n=1 Tax=Halalkalibacter akibai (strain ATCC 43226 / DSM 21942 / CIP 109018 / JCM 9157 / 1139) TaxID=1236973 RepID=W4R041_HALA3|nr:hypothetical protein [Halalkalibacter akibai]GAE37288.1 hypothetical protein JCM9157_4562 [Halalkalibacter akibai JCM 9157]
MKKRIVLFLFALLIATTVWYTFPKTLVKQLDGVYYQLGKDEIIRNIAVQIDGTLQKSLLGKRTFKGEIKIEGEDFVVPANQRQLELTFSKADNRGFLNYGYVDDEANPKVYSYGVIYMNPDFTEFTIAKYEKDHEEDFGGSWSGADGFMITAPADDRASAITISNRLMKNFLLEGDLLR